MKPLSRRLYAITAIALAAVLFVGLNIAVDAVGADQAEIDDIAGIGRRGGETIGGGFVFGRRVGLRVDLFQDDFAAAQRGVFVQ